jgi:hypothetical protein
VNGAVNGGTAGLDAVPPFGHHRQPCLAAAGERGALIAEASTMTPCASSLHARESEALRLLARQLFSQAAELGDDSGVARALARMAERLLLVAAMGPLDPTRP